MNDLGCQPITPEIKSKQTAGQTNHLNMYWSWDGKLNFGDWVGPYIFKALTGQAPLHCRVWPIEPPNSLFFTCGSILRKLKKDDVAIVWGSGSMHAYTKPKRPLKTLALRGPRSQQIFDRLGYDVPDVIGDPGICMPLFHQASGEKTHRLGFIPHGFDKPYWAEKGVPGDVLMIDVHRNVTEVIDDIARCEVIVSSSLHGIIMAHSYGIPAVWTRSASRQLEGDDTKFLDYFESVGLQETDCPALEVKDLDNWDAFLSASTLPATDIRAMALRLVSVCPFLALDR